MFTPEDLFFLLTTIFSLILVYKYINDHDIEFVNPNEID